MKEKEMGEIIKIIGGALVEIFVVALMSKGGKKQWKKYYGFPDTVDVFRKLDFKTEAKEETVIVTVPTRRIDISIRADLIEEVGRIYGVDNIQGKLPVVPMKMGHLDKTARKIRAKMKIIYQMQKLKVLKITI